MILTVRLWCAGWCWCCLAELADQTDDGCKGDMAFCSRTKIRVTEIPEVQKFILRACFLSQTYPGPRFRSLEVQWISVNMKNCITEYDMKYWWFFSKLSRLALHFDFILDYQYNRLFGGLLYIFSPFLRILYTVYSTTFLFNWLMKILISDIYTSILFFFACKYIT